MPQQHWNYSSCASGERDDAVMIETTANQTIEMNGRDRWMDGWRDVVGGGQRGDWHALRARSLSTARANKHTCIKALRPPHTSVGVSSCSPSHQAGSSSIGLD